MTDRPGTGTGAQHTSEDIHRALFPTGKPTPKGLKQLKEGITEAVRRRHERGKQKNHPGK
jgi:hypothetical protein